MRWEDVVVLAGALPGVEVSTSYGTPSLKAGGKLITRLSPEADSLVLLSAPVDERDMLIEADPSTFHTTPHYENYPAVLARLVPLAADRLWPFIERRWRAVAPKRDLARHSPRDR